jgi:antirestriction protein ArdC
MSWKNSASTEHRDAMQEFTTKIAEQLELGVKPWVRPWEPLKCTGPQSPFNAVTGHRYSGINVLVLAMDPRAFATGDPRYCTYKQAQDHHWQVRKNEKATTVFLYKPLEIEDEKAKDGTRVVPLLRTFPVFHASQIDGVPPYRPPPIEECPWQSDAACSIIMENSKVPLRIGGDRAFYSPSLDFIQVPAHRLNRDMTGSFGSVGYAEEELIAEIASSFVGVTLNLPTDIPNHANYIGHWLEKLKGDKRFIFKAAAAAQRAADWILNLHPDYAARVEPDRPPAATDDPQQHPQPD